MGEPQPGPARRRAAAMNRPFLMNDDLFNSFLVHLRESNLRLVEMGENRRAIAAAVRAVYVAPGQVPAAYLRRVVDEAQENAEEWDRQAERGVPVLAPRNAEARQFCDELLRICNRDQHQLLAQIDSRTFKQLAKRRLFTRAVNDENLSWRDGEVWSRLRETFRGWVARHRGLEVATAAVRGSYAALPPLVVSSSGSSASDEEAAPPVEAATSSSEEGEEPRVERRASTSSSGEGEEPLEEEPVAAPMQAELMRENQRLHERIEQLNERVERLELQVQELAAANVAFRQRDQRSL